MRRLTLFIALPLFLGACVPVTPDDEHPSELGSEEAPAGEEFTVTLPDGWERQEDDEAEFSAQNMDEDMYLTVLSEAKADFEFDLAGYAEQVIAILVENTGGEIVSGPTETTVDNHRALRYEVRGTSDGVNIVYLDTVIEGERDYHQLASFTLASSYEANKAEMLSLADGFDIK